MYLYILLLHNFLRYVINRVLYGNNYISEIVERISPKATIRLFDKGRIKIGYNIELAPLVNIQVHGNGTLSIGNRVYMNRGCIVSCHSNISIGDGCLFGPGVKIFDNNHKFQYKVGVSTDLNIGNITIGQNCWIASDVIILKGAQIGDNCVIGAGCIINSFVDSNSIVRNVQTLNIESIR